MPAQPDGDVVPLADLTEKERRFVEAFGDPESETFARRTASAEAAGYSGGRTAAWKILQRPRVREALKIYAEQAQRGLDFVMLQVEHIGRKAYESGDWSTALRASELLAKRLGGFVERLMISADARDVQRELSEAEEEEARRLADLRLGVVGGDAASAAAEARALISGQSGKGA